MSSKTLELSEDILAEKTSKIIPENIKKGIKIFDVTGIVPDGSDFILNTEFTFNFTKSTTKNDVVQSDNLPSGTVIVNKSGEPLGYVLHKKGHLYTWGWNGTKLVNKVDTTLSSLGCTYSGSSSWYLCSAGVMHDDNTGIIGFATEYSSPVYFMLYNITYTLEDGINCPKITISNKKKWRLYHSDDSFSIPEIVINPWNDHNAVVAGTYYEYFINLPEVADNTWGTPTVTKMKRTSNYAVGNQGFFAREGKVYYTRNSNSQSYSDVYLLNDNYIPIKKNSLTVHMLSPDGEYAINNNKVRYKLNYSTDGTITTTSLGTVSDITVSVYQYMGSGIFNNMLSFAIGHDQYGCILYFYKMNWETGEASYLHHEGPISGTDYGYWFYHHNVSNTGDAIFINWCGSDEAYSKYSEKDYPRMIGMYKNYDKVNSITYKNVTYYPNEP